MSVVTYGELVDRAGCSLARAMATPIDPGDAAELTRVAVGLDLVRDAARRHAELAADPWQGSAPPARRASPIQALAEALHPRWLPADPPGGICDTVDPAWRQAVQSLGVAGDLLATHLGPHGRPLTGDAHHIVDPDGRAQLARHAAWFAETTSEYALYVAHRAANGPQEEFLDAVVALWFHHGGSVRSAAYRTLHDSVLAAGHDALAGLAPAPLLRCEPVVSLGGAFRAYDRLRRLAHAQAVGDLRADAASLRGFAALGYTITGHAHLVHAAVSERASDLGLDHTAGDQHRRTADRLRQANTAWGALHAALADIRDAGGAPAGWRTDVLGVREQLDRLVRRDGRLLPAQDLVPDSVTARSLLAVVDRFTAGLPDIATGQRDSVRRLHRTGQLHVPTSQLPRADVPRPYAPLPHSRLDALLTACQVAATATREAVDGLSRTDSRRRDSSPQAARRPARPRRVDSPHPQAAEAPVIAR